MKKLLLSGLLLLASLAGAQAQCVGVGGVNNVPVPGLNCNQESVVTSYAATSIGLVPGTAPTDIACIAGSATKTVRLKQIAVSGVAGTAINMTVVITKHASLDTGGTLALTTAIPLPYAMDSANAAATASTRAWTVNPTIADAAPGIIGAKTGFFPATGTATSALPAFWDWGDDIAMQMPILRGTTQEICVNLNGVTAPSSGVFTVSFLWTEAAQ